MYIRKRPDESSQCSDCSFTCATSVDIDFEKLAFGTDELLID
jgi:hypothetical protein